MKKITFKRQQLLDALQFGSMYAGTNKIMPILDNIIIMADPSLGNVMISSTNTDITANVWLRADVQSDGGMIAACVEPKTLRSIIGTLSCEDVEMFFGDTCEVVYGNGKCTLPLFDKEEYPKKEIKDIAEVAKMPCDTLSYIISTCKPFIGNDELRPTMKNIYIRTDKDKGTLEYCATDSHRLVNETISEGIEIFESGEYLIPKFAIPAILLAAKDNPSVEIGSDGTNIRFGFQDKSVSCSTYSGKYPNFRPIVDMASKNTKRCCVDKDDLENAVIRASVCANNQTRTVKLSFGEKMKVEADDADFGRSIAESIGVLNREGEDVEFGMNAMFLSDMLGIISSKDVEILAETSSKAVIFNDHSHHGRCALLMPVMLNC